MAERKQEGEVGEVAFEVPGREAEKVKLTGISKEVLRSPEKIKQLMDVLELPEGTNALVSVKVTSAIVR